MSPWPSNGPAVCAMVKPMRTARARAKSDQAEEGVVLTPEEEAELEDVIAETDEDLRQGRAIPWDQFLAERPRRRG